MGWYKCKTADDTIGLFSATLYHKRPQNEGKYWEKRYKNAGMKNMKNKVTVDKTHQYSKEVFTHENVTLYHFAYFFSASCLFAYA